MIRVLNDENEVELYEEDSTIDTLIRILQAISDPGLPVDANILLNTHDGEVISLTVLPPSSD